MALRVIFTHLWAAAAVIAKLAFCLGAAVALLSGVGLLVCYLLARRSPRMTPVEAQLTD